MNEELNEKLRELRGELKSLMTNLNTNKVIASDAEQFVQECIRAINVHLDNEEFVKLLDNRIKLHDGELFLTRSNGRESVTVVELNEKGKDVILEPKEIVKRYGATIFGTWVETTIRILNQHYEARNQLDIRHHRPKTST